MRLGVLSDIHANKPAFEAVLADMPEVDRLVCAGDVVGYNPWPGACVDVVRERDIPCVQGNHDRAVATGAGMALNRLAQAGVEFAREQLTDEQIRWLERLPIERRVADGRVKLVHGHPDDPDRYTYPSGFSADLLGDEEVLVLGHTHVQYSETYERGIVLNPGSVGQPRDGNPRAAYAILDLEAMVVEERRVAYDIEAVRRAVEAARLPAQIGDRLVQGR